MSDPLFDLQTNVFPQIHFLESLRHHNPQARVHLYRLQGAIRPGPDYSHLLPEGLKKTVEFYRKNRQHYW